MNLNGSTLAAGLALATLACSAESQDTSASARYVIDPSHTHVQFSVERFGFNDVIVTFKDVSGEIVLDMDAPENSRVEATIGTASVYSGDDTRDEHLRGPFWFKVDEFASAAFSSTSVDVTGENTAVVNGDLTIMGVTKPVSLEVTLNKIGMDPATKREAAGFSATTQLVRDDFGLTTAGPLIGHDVAIRIETLAHRADG